MSDPYEEYEELKQVLYQVRTELATAREAFNRADALNIKLQSREWAVREELSTTRAELERTRQELVRCGVEARRLVAIEVDNLRENLSIAQQKSDNLRAELALLQSIIDESAGIVRCPKCGSDSFEVSRMGNGDYWLHCSGLASPNCHNKVYGKTLGRALASWIVGAK